jgi:glycosyltransferase involved in cell wall biosynthesis
MLSELSSADYLLVCATEKRHVPGKLFEYLRTGKPIIAFGQDNDEVNKILQEANAGVLFKYNEDVSRFFELAETFKTEYNSVKQYDRKIISRKLTEILNKVVK